MITINQEGEKEKRKKGKKKKKKNSKEMQKSFLLLLLFLHHHLNQPSMETHDLIEPDTFLGRMFPFMWPTSEKQCYDAEGKLLALAKVPITRKYIFFSLSFGSRQAQKGKKSD